MIVFILCVVMLNVMTPRREELKFWWRSFGWSEVLLHVQFTIKIVKITSKNLLSITIFNALLSNTQKTSNSSTTSMSDIDFWAILILFKSTRQDFFKSRYHSIHSRSVKKSSSCKKWTTFKNRGVVSGNEQYFFIVWMRKNNIWSTWTIANAISSVQMIVNNISVCKWDFDIHIFKIL